MFTLTLQESMKGWMELNETRKQETMEFDIDITFTNRSKPWKPQPFIGTLRLIERNLEVETHGYLTLKPLGTRYELRFRLPQMGSLEAKGEKSFDLLNLKESFTTCPLTIYQAGQAIGYAEVVNQQTNSVLPLKGVRVST